MDYHDQNNKWGFKRFIEFFNFNLNPGLGYQITSDEDTEYDGDGFPLQFYYFLNKLKIKDFDGNSLNNKLRLTCDTGEEKTEDIHRVDSLLDHYARNGLDNEYQLTLLKNGYNIMNQLKLTKLVGMRNGQIMVLSIVLE